MTGISVLIILSAMAGSWLFRSLLLRTLRNAHPREYAELGQPSGRQLASLLPRYRELQLRFWRYLWGGRFRQTNDKAVSALAWAALSADVAVAIGVAAFLWSTRR